MTLTLAQVQHIARLARLQLSPEELERYREQLSEILDYAARLQELDTTGIPPEQMPRMYLDIGDHDRPEISESAVWFEQLLTDLGIPHEWHLYVGFHDEAYWERHVKEYVRWYTLPWLE